MPSLSPIRHLRHLGSVALPCLALLALACKGAPPPLATVPADGWRAESLDVWDAERLTAALQGREALLVALWAHWCEPCIAEMVELSALATSRPDWGVLGLATDDTGSPSIRARVQGVLDKVRPTHPQGRIQPGGEFRLLEALGLTWDGILPKTFVLTRRGTFLLAAQTQAELVPEVERLLQDEESRAPPDERHEGARP